MDVNQSEGHSVRGDSRVSRDRDDSCLVHELGKHQSRQAEHGYKGQTSVECADTTPVPESLHLRCVFLILWAIDWVHISASASASAMEVCG